MSQKIMAQTQCSQCGATDFEHRADGFISCAYCHSVYKIQSNKAQSTLVIKKGANVVFGKNANVTVRGGVEIEAGANVSLDGKLEIIEVADAETVRLAKAKLQRIEKNP